MTAAVNRAMRRTLRRLDQPEHAAHPAIPTAQDALKFSVDRSSEYKQSPNIASAARCEKSAQFTARTQQAAQDRESGVAFDARCSVMQKRKLGKSNLEVSGVGLGCMGRLQRKKAK